MKGEDTWVSTELREQLPLPCGDQQHQSLWQQAPFSTRGQATHQKVLNRDSSGFPTRAETGKSLKATPCSPNIALGLNNSSTGSRCNPRATTEGP